MPYTYSQLENMARPDKPEAKAMKGGLGLYLRMYPSGDHQWYWRGTLVTPINSKPLWVQIGALSENRLTADFLKTEAVRLKGLAKKGIDPNKPEVIPAPPKIPTLQEVWERFCTDFLPTRSDAYADGQKNAWDLHVKTGYGALHLDQVNTATCNAILQPLIAQKHYTTANRLRSTLSKLCNWCRGLYPDFIGNKPNWIAASPKQEELPEERSLSEAELKLFGKGYKASNALHKEAILWLLITGSRGGLLEAYDPKWQNGNFLLIPQGTKQVKKARFIVMPNSAMRLLSHMHLPVTVSGLRHALDDICDKGGIRGKCSPRTLRKTFSSLGADWDEMEAAIDTLQNHKGSRIRQAYLQRSLKPLLPVAERIASRMLRIMDIRVR